MKQDIITIQAETKAPSNIAVVKYWGKKGVQEPCNPSISFTLTESVSTCSISYSDGNEPLKLDFTFEGRPMPSFQPKLNTWIGRIIDILPWLKKGLLRIDSANTFPHSSGIASSASSIAAMAEALMQADEKMNGKRETTTRSEMVSEMARLGSGSACRSTMKGWVLWGSTEEHKGSNDKYGVLLNDKIHPVFETLNDSILVIRKGKKAVSSTVGHSLMDSHFYREGRIIQANSHTKEIINILQSGDFEAFCRICESEAMSLHGLMMSSTPSYTLLAPESLEAIRRILAYREKTGIDVTYTLDAGPNIHIIYPDREKESIRIFIKDELQELCEENLVIHDHISLQ